MKLVVKVEIQGKMYSLEQKFPGVSEEQFDAAVKLGLAEIDVMGITFEVRQVGGKLIARPKGSA
jgi:hypothetical protein